MMTRCLICGMVLLLCEAVAVAQDSKFHPQNQQIPVPDCLVVKGLWEGENTPCTSADHELWLKDIQHWRFARRIRIGYNGDRYAIPELRWTQSSFFQPQMMVHERYFYDPVEGKYTVDRYLDDLEKRYGGIDAVLIWPTYPNMGIDNRNQHDMIRWLFVFGTEFHQSRKNVPPFRLDGEPRIEVATRRNPSAVPGGKRRRSQGA